MALSHSWSSHAVFLTWVLTRMISLNYSRLWILTTTVSKPLAHWPPQSTPLHSPPVLHLVSAQSIQRAHAPLPQRTALGGSPCPITCLIRAQSCTVVSFALLLVLSAHPDPPPPPPLPPSAPPVPSPRHAPLSPPLLPLTTISVALRSPQSVTTIPHSHPSAPQPCKYTDRLGVHTQTLRAESESYGSTAREQLHKEIARAH